MGAAELCGTGIEASAEVSGPPTLSKAGRIENSSIKAFLSSGYLE